MRHIIKSWETRTVSREVGRSERNTYVTEASSIRAIAGAERVTQDAPVIGRIFRLDNVISEGSRPYSGAGRTLRLLRVSAEESATLTACQQDGCQQVKEVTQ